MDVILRITPSPSAPLLAVFVGEIEGGPGAEVEVEGGVVAEGPSEVREVLETFETWDTWDTLDAVEPRPSLEALDRRGSTAAAAADAGAGGGGGGGGGSTGVTGAFGAVAEATTTGTDDDASLILCSVHSKTNFPVLSSFTKFSGSK